MQFIKRMLGTAVGAMLFQRCFKKGVLVSAKKTDCAYTILQCFFSAVFIKAAIFMIGSFSKIYLHYGVFNRGTNLVSV